MNLEALGQPAEQWQNTEPMPVLFVGHGSPMNAIEDNEFSRQWHAVGRTLPTPQAILCISAHWETRGTHVTAMEQPRTIHDFGGFPRELYAAQYPAPGSPQLAQETKDTVKKTRVEFDHTWGLDHGTWSILKHMFPNANVPVVQLSLDDAKSPQAHYDLAKELSPLRNKGVLIIGSGNIVHNLQLVVFNNDNFDFNEPFALDWAREAHDLVNRLINANDHAALIDYPSLGKAMRLAVPTAEHYLPLLYALALKEDNDSISYFNDKAVAGSLTMTSLTIERAK